MKRFVRFIEGFVTIAIVLVLLQTLAEDFFTVLGASWQIRKIFLYTSFAFDLLFTLEFLIRSWNAILNRSFGRYLVRENGWVDFIASAPLLIFTSGPAFISLLGGAAFAGTGALIGLLKVVKAVRMARVLRLLRLLKIFRRIRFADSAMVQRHTVRIVTTAAATLIFSVTGIGVLFAAMDYTGTDEIWIAQQGAFISALDNESIENAELKSRAEANPSVMLLKKGNDTIHASHDDAYFTRFFGPGDFSVRRAGGCTIWFDIRPAAVSQAKLNLTIFLSTLTVVLLIMVTYSPHFAITVSDPVNVMTRGLKEKSYNLEVIVPAVYAEDDVFRLAEAFNNEYLPLKERSALEDQGAGASLDISLDDISDLLGS